MPKKNEKQEEIQQESKFTKQQIITSNKFKHRVDLINTLLKDDELYTINQVEEKINKFLKRKV